jgi:hypothetical protein
MNNAIGFNGNPSMNPGFTHNPLNSIVPNNISLTASELNAAIKALGYPRWGILNEGQKKFVKAYALQQRGDPTSSAQADQVLIGNPAFSGLTILMGAAAL